MPLYEYYCDKCDSVFEALRSVSQSDQPAECPKCGGPADRIMPTTFSSMVRKQGWRQRAPFHQSGVRAEKDGKKTVARVKPKTPPPGHGPGSQPGGGAAKPPAKPAARAGRKPGGRKG